MSWILNCWNYSLSITPVFRIPFLRIPYNHFLEYGMYTLLQIDKLHVAVCGIVLVMGWKILVPSLQMTRFSILLGLLFIKKIRYRITCSSWRAKYMECHFGFYRTQMRCFTGKSKIEMLREFRSALFISLSPYILCRQVWKLWPACSGKKSPTCSWSSWSTNKVWAGSSWQEQEF